MNPADHQRFMARALQLARRGMTTTDPNPRVGCVIVKQGDIVGEGWHVRAGGPHAEVVALDAAGALSRGASVYVTLEPCAHRGKTGPCDQKLIDAGVGRVFAAMRDPNPAVSGKGIEALRAAGIEVFEGLMGDDAQTLNPGFVSRMTKGRPFLRLKLAMSLDGRTALASGESRWVTGQSARDDVQRLRARSSAILTGVDTVIADNPRLNVRAGPIDKSFDSDPAVRQPLRIIVDSRLRTPPESRLLSESGRVLIATVDAKLPGADALLRAGAKLMEVPARGERVDLKILLTGLAEREINELHVECGPTLAGALIDARLVDELVVYVAPALFGADANPLASLLPVSTMKERVELKFDQIRAVGGDLRIRARFSGA